MKYSNARFACPAVGGLARSVRNARRRMPTCADGPARAHEVMRPGLPLIRRTGEGQERN